MRPKLERELAILQALPKSASAHNGVGTVLITENRPDEAIKHFQSAISLNREDDAAYDNWGNALQVLGRPQEAIARYQEALRIRPDNAKTHSNLGNALQQRGR